MLRLSALIVLLSSLSLFACEEDLNVPNEDMSVDSSVGFIDYKMQTTEADQDINGSDALMTDVSVAGEMMAGEMMAGEMMAGEMADMAIIVEIAGAEMAGVEIAGDVTPICVPSAEQCDGIDNDCDGNTDELLEMRCSEPERGGMLGLCGEAKSFCENGEWSSCSVQDLAERQTALGNLINTVESCDCYDNNCNGIVDEPNELTAEGNIDWRANTCTPNMSSFSSPRPYHPQCHFYSMYDQESGSPVPHYLEVSGEYYVDSFVVHEGTRVYATRPNREIGPGYSQTIPSLCIENRWMIVGGDFSLNANYIEVQQNAALLADSISSTCRASGLYEFESIPGASGGNLHLYANHISISGHLTAIGATPSNVEPTFGNYDAYAGGAAGSIYVVAPTLNLNGAMINARGGRGACPAINVFNREYAALCDDSLHAGEGPGLAGGRPVEGQRIGGAGSGGAGHDQVDSNRRVSILGSMPSNSSATLQIHDGTGPRTGFGRCSGHLLLSGGTRRLVDRIECTGEHPETFKENYITIMLLDDDGHLQRNASLDFKVFGFQPNMPLMQDNFRSGAVTISSSNTFVQRGSNYTFELSSRRVDDDTEDEDLFYDDDDLDDYQFLVLVEYPDMQLYQETLTISEAGLSTFEVP